MAKKKKIIKRKNSVKKARQNTLYMPLVIIIVAAILGWAVGRFIFAGRLHLGQTVNPSKIELR